MYHFRRIDYWFDQIQGENYFSKNDLHLGYYKLNVKDEDILIMAFKIRYGHREFFIMFFCLTNASEKFMDLMNIVY